MMNRSFDIQQEYQKWKQIVQPYLQTAAQKSQYHDSDMIDLCQNDEQLAFDNAAYMPSLEMLTKVLPVLDIQVWDVEPFTDGTNVVGWTLGFAPEIGCIGMNIEALMKKHLGKTIWFHPPYITSVQTYEEIWPIWKWGTFLKQFFEYAAETRNEDMTKVVLVLPVTALTTVHALVAEARKARGKNPQCWFALHKCDRKLDRMGKGSSCHYTNVTFAEVLAFVEYELTCNDIFVAGNRVLRQRRGLAIGGTCSAQLACLYCMYQEHEWYKRGFASYVDRVEHWMHPSSVPLFPFRFRDNIVGVAWGDVPLSAIHGYFSEVYNPELQMEGEGDTLPSFESTTKPV